MPKQNCKSSKSNIVAARFPNELINRLQLAVEQTSIKKNDLIVAAVDQALRAFETSGNKTAISEMRSPFSHN
jgi:hypothetical protein